jgi:hypothetical protein
MLKKFLIGRFIGKSLTDFSVSKGRAEPPHASGRNCA